METKPKPVMIYVFDRDRRFVHIVLESKNTPGTMAGIGSVFQRLGIVMLNGFAAGERSGKTLWSIFAEANAKVEDLEDAFRSLPTVEDVTVREGVNGLLVDSQHFPVVMEGGERLVIMRQSMLTDMFGRAKNIFGSGGDVILYVQGEEYGRRAAETWAALLGEKFVREHPNEALQTLSAAGWARIELLAFDLDGRRIVVRLHDNFECLGRKSGGPYSNFVRGYLCGMAQALMPNVAVQCKETVCVAAGGEYCEFETSEEGAKRTGLNPF
ncbi:MAG: hypothetical protein JRN39_04795 [Nitrososphaerota archaeon]|nr:hypothetical protein [Nitrososphaerota archaeon]